MITRHVKINQLDINKLNTHSNNDILLNEISFSIHFENEKFSLRSIPQFTDFLIQGLHFIEHRSLSKLMITNSDQLIFNVSESNDHYAFSSHDCSNLEIQHQMIVNWVRQFKESQPIYRQTGATEAVAILLKDGQLLSIECINTRSAFTKLIGALIKKEIEFYPILFLSHKLMNDSIELIKLLNIELIVCQSAISATALDLLNDLGCTVFGFCRKNKFNRYSNFHI